MSRFVFLRAPVTFPSCKRECWALALDVSFYFFLFFVHTLFAWCCGVPSALFVVTYQSKRPRFSSETPISKQKMVVYYGTCDLFLALVVCGTLVPGSIAELALRSLIAGRWKSFHPRAEPTTRDEVALRNTYQSPLCFCSFVVLPLKSLLYRFLSVLLVEALSWVHKCRLPLPPPRTCSHTRKSRSLMAPVTPSGFRWPWRMSDLRGEGR